ncbi:MAG: GNAT family N-acetyltransferase [Parachlamydiaceae bacterium]|nr:GNAT family N-acetyltransferase [Parachlamydiaceae bacterium]
MISEKDFAYDCNKSLYSQLGLPIHEEFGTYYSQTKVPHPLLNGVLRCNTPDANIEGVVKKVISHFNALQLPHSWWVEESEAPPSLKSILERNGLNYLGKFSVLLLDIKHTLPVVESDAKIDIVRDEAHLSIWGDILSHAFQIPPTALSIFLKLMQKASGCGDFTNVLAHKSGKGIATGSITITNDGGYICNDCTMDEARNLGYGKAITCKLLDIAQKSDCRRVGVISAPSELEDYKQLGFVEQGVFHIYTTNS